MLQITAICFSPGQSSQGLPPYPPRLKKKEEKDEEANACASAAKAQPERRVNINVSSDSVYNRFYDAQLRLRR